MNFDPTQIRIDTREKRPTYRPRAPSDQPSMNWVAVLLPILLLLGAVVAGIAAVPMRLGPEWLWEQTAAELEQQYAMLVEMKAPQMERAIRAGAIAEAYLQAKDREGYRLWKDAADRHMRAAGVPTMR